MTDRLPHFIWFTMMVVSLMNMAVVGFVSKGWLNDGWLWVTGLMTPSQTMAVSTVSILVSYLGFSIHTHLSEIDNTPDKRIHGGE